jgi:type II secretory pathway pseudopilin PulG
MSANFNDEGLTKLRKGRSREGGFTMAEIMISMIVFVIALVGLVAMESRAVEAQRASMEIREAERIAQEVMSDLNATSFNGLVERGFDGAADPNFPYDDLSMGTHELRHYRGVPADSSGTVPGTRTDFYWVGRT